jgi:hypothetical protein
MMKEYYWKLEEYKGQNTRFRCPRCRKPREYTRFVNSEGEYADFEYGKCNRVEKCGYFSYPNGITSFAPKFIHKLEVQEYIDWMDYTYSLDTDSEFIRALLSLFSETKVLETLKKYFIRTDGDSMIYPYVDSKNRLTYVKKMDYKGINRTSGIYTPYKAKKGRFKQCLFGLHLVNRLKGNCVVESEKTALICDIVYPEYTWVATGGLGMISKINVLDTATVFPDKGKAFKSWSDKVDSKRFTMSNKVENSELPAGSDLADLLLRPYN